MTASFQLGSLAPRTRSTRAGKSTLIKLILEQLESSPGADIFGDPDAGIPKDGADAREREETDASGGSQVPALATGGTDS